MTIDVTDWSMISDRSPESAHRTADSGAEAWRLSWLPDRRLTHAQALAGMRFDELAGDPLAVDNPAAQALMDGYAGELGLTTAQAILLLAERMVARLMPPDEDGTPCASRGHVIEPPYVFG
ncbi:hypothetical protein DFR70_101505 [Nocardia tenerifensis]|uniref:Uncharacterized protein n=1 Tax=Nocardia tenerifensis TaxID=228006 RepID=A0A318KZ04_9NOCA|nr:hypothetical protein [Nocardia tenerifensis]PXX71084.1 hypothetical protein DFR70_101505 [Nocardia tenerifensis]